MPGPADDRRQFHRILTDQPVEVRSAGHPLNGRLIDISLHGLLFECATDWQPAIDAPVRVRVLLTDDPRQAIEMDGRIAHRTGRRIGVRCVALDLDSASRLRRLVELNLADAALLERDLEQLLTV